MKSSMEFHGTAVAVGRVGVSCSSQSTPVKLVDSHYQSGIVSEFQ